MMGMQHRLLSLLLVWLSLWCSSVIFGVKADLFSAGNRPSRIFMMESSSLIPPVGDIDDTQCNIEDLERANDSQLHVIFRELKQTNFFRHFVVDLEHKCPLSRWRTSKKEDDRHNDSHNSNIEVADAEEGEEDGEFECSGGLDELDEDAEPLCTVQDMDELTALGGGGVPPFESSVLQSLSQQGFSSQFQRETFEWKQQTDMVVQEDETPCDEPGSNLPDTFWMDLCSNIQSGQGTKLINLNLNPERNTGYNGTHIWKAIYEENCLTTSDSCLEERVLYRLLSGLHTSTTLSIAKNYYPPSKRKGRTGWEANPEYFMEKFQRHPEYIRNMHFAYVVMLRAIKKASDYLYKYDIQSGNTMDDQASKVLLRRLLDTAILRSCSSVFSAFDESLMFQHQDVSIQQNFKGVFHNISSILDCVQCQQCKLHGKMQMMGYGAALKTLFVRPELIELDRNEVVALINTAARLSESLVEVRELTAMYWEKQWAMKNESSSSLASPQKTPSSTPVPYDQIPQRNMGEGRERTKEASSPQNTPSLSPALDQGPVHSFDLLDMTVGTISALGRENMISWDREKELIELALNRHPELLVLGKHYRNDLQRFLALTASIQSIGGAQENLPDAIVVGSGLAGLAASLNILDRGGTVIVLEKEHLLGGNSNKASSGINACCPHKSNGDSLESFSNDTIRSAGEVADLALIEALVSKSEDAVMWLQERANVDLSLLAQLGGHSHKRTHRPNNGMAGAEIIYHMQKAVRSYEKSGKVKIMVDTKVTELMTENDRVVGVLCESTKDGSVLELRADNVILATGGFASDRSKGSYLDQHRPEFMSFPATAGSFSTGDGIKLATGLGAATRDMEKVQIHPTGWVDPVDPSNPTKVLAAELMRGVGGILLNKEGKRFCNELGTRAYVTDRMLSHDPIYASTLKWDIKSDVPTFHLILSSEAAADGKKHVDLYTHKGLLKKLEGIDALAKHIGVSKTTLEATLRGYVKASAKGIDEFGKTSFRGLPMEDLSTEVFYAGVVTPVLHYCMGGIKIDTEGNVLRDDGTNIPGLHAAGEVTGGVHGNNRLGGNSLLECTVFGTIVGQKIPVKAPQCEWDLGGSASSEQESMTADQLPKITMEDLAKHNSKEDLWVAINGIVYDFTEFAHEHPAGFDSIFELAGTDGTEAFSSVHNELMLEDFDEERKGLLQTS